MRDEYMHLWEGRLYADGKLVVTGRIQWLLQGWKYAGMRFHTEPLTAEQVQSILEGPLLLAFFDGNGKAYELGAATMRADQLREKAEEVVIMATGKDGWDLGLLTQRILTLPNISRYYRYSGNAVPINA